MERRDFIKASCCTGIASLTGASVALGQDFIPTQRQPNETATQYAQRVARERALAEQARRMARERTLTASGVATRCYALWRYTIANPAQKQRFDTFVEGALIPALNRAGIEQVGVFSPEGEFASNRAYLLLSQSSIGNMTSLSICLARDEEYTEMTSAFLQTHANGRPYQRKDVQLVASLTKMTSVEAPAPGADSILQLRSYECFDAGTELKAIEMFNATGIAVLLETGVSPVFFGQTIAGENMPNLTCLLAAADVGTHELGRRQLLSQTEYNVSELVYTVTDETLKPAAYSQI